MSEVFDCLFPSEANANDVIIQQGDEGDNFYIIEKVKIHTEHSCNNPLRSGGS